MAISKNIDRYYLDETFDLDPKIIQSAFQSANRGHCKKQSRIANEILEKDPSAAQAWNVRVAAVSGCPWEIVGDSDKKNKSIENSLLAIQPSIQSGLCSFYELLEFLQTAAFHGFSLSTIDWSEGRSSIRGFKNYAHSLFSFVDSDMPYFTSNFTSLKNQKKIYPKYPEWVYHKGAGSRQSEPLRSGLVRILAYLYCFARTVKIEYLRGLEKYGLPTPAISIDPSMYDDENDKKSDLIDFFDTMTYDGYIVFDRDKMEVTFPTSNVFNAEDFKVFLDHNERQIFRLILGQDSTSSSDNSNRSTAQVHNLVRQDILSSDTRSIEETVNNQIIKPLFEAKYGTEEERPFFRFRTKTNTELQEMANFVKVLGEAGYEVDRKDLSRRFGLTIKEKAVKNGNN